MTWLVKKETSETFWKVPTRKQTQRKIIKIWIPKKMLQRLPIALKDMIYSFFVSCKINYYKSKEQ